VAVEAKVFTIGGFSAHADQKDLLTWVGHFESKPKVFVVHGESTSSKVLKSKIEKVFGLSAHVPRWRERLILKPREMSIEEPEAEEGRPVAREVLLNTVLDIEKALKELKKQIKVEEAEVGLGDEKADRLLYFQEELEILLDEFQAPSQD